MTAKRKLPSMLTRQVVYDGLSYILRGGLLIKNGHLPPDNHIIPADFFGVCVASSADPAVDDYVISQLNQLGTKQVRLDFSYGDLTSFNARFLSALIAHKFEVSMHLVQPFEAAKNMESPAEQDIWRQFLRDVLEQFGSKVRQIEVGTTINRKRWAGYSMPGFLTAWGIAHHEIRGRNLTLAGPNLSDFEPIYNIGLLQSFKEKKQLPDIHTDNLFSERVSEPERFDHRIFKYRWATIFKYNLVKKARILKKISTDFGVATLVSPVAFWAIYRIQRLLPDGEQKQADYAARYLTLTAASNSLAQVFWGALICQREGLINDGLQESDYPPLERVTHYKSVDGKLANYVPRASFNAVKTVISLIQDAHYVRHIASAQGLEIHHFEQDNRQIHAAWTINGKVAFLSDVYEETSLNAATMLHRDGGLPHKNFELITESPIYLQWHADFPIKTKAQPALEKDLAIHAHINGLQYFRVNEDDWQGLVLAKDANEANMLMQALHPSKLLSPAKDAALRHARNAIWSVADPRDSSRQITVKQPVKMYPHKAFLDRFKPSKARRSWNGAMELLRRGVKTAQPVAFFEKTGDSTLKQNFYLCDYVQADCNVGQLFSAFASGEPAFLGLTPEEVYPQLAQYCHIMHSHGIHFRDLSGGNILVNILADHKLQFSLIDTARLHSFNHPVALKLRVADLTRACHKLHWAERKRFMHIYLGLTGRKLRWQDKLQFHLYDLKVSLKRTIGRKGIKRLLKRIKSAQ